MEPEEEQKPRGMPEYLRNLVRETKAKIEADNARLCEERNARRWKSERDPEEYALQKERQRQEYAEAQGGSVRPYAKIEATTVIEHKEKARKRDADRQKERYNNMSPSERQAKSDRIANKRLIDRCRKKGMSEDEIQAALNAKIIEREDTRAASAQQDKDEDEEMKKNPFFGMFGMAE